MLQHVSRNKDVLMRVSWLEACSCRKDLLLSALSRLTRRHRGYLVSMMSWDTRRRIRDGIIIVFEQSTPRSSDITHLYKWQRDTILVSTASALAHDTHPPHTASLGKPRCQSYRS